MNNLKRYRMWIFLVLLIAPVALRGLWFYPSLSARPEVKSPDYASYTIPQPPVSTAAPDPVTASADKVVVIDYMHGNQFTRSEIDAFVAALNRRGARLEFDSGDIPLANRLKYASAYVVFAPNYTYSVEEVNLVNNFVNSGGRLVVFTDPTRGTSYYDSNTGASINTPDADAANNLLAPFDITITNDYLYNLVKNDGNFRNTLFNSFAGNPVTTGLSQVAFYGTHSVETGSGTKLILGDGNTVSSLTDSAGAGRAAAALGADGNVLALGDFSFLIPPYDSVADNQVLIRNIANFALSGTRSHRVADFPYVFDRTVSIVSTGGLQTTADTLAPFAGLQNALRLTGTSLVMSDTAPADGDLLVIGSLTPGEDLLPYLQPFKLGLEDPGTVVIPGFGTVARSGVGLLLYQHTPERNTLILLTDTPADLPALINLLSSADLSACVIQGDIGVCSIGYGGGYSNGPAFEPTPDGFSPTPTASG
jgi:hypothetical protein